MEVDFVGTFSCTIPPLCCDFRSTSGKAALMPRNSSESSNLMAVPCRCYHSKTSFGYSMKQSEFVPVCEVFKGNCTEHTCENSLKHVVQALNCPVQTKATCLVVTCI